MKALRVHGFEGWHQWSLDEVPEPEPGLGQLRIAVETVAPSFVDLLYARGGYQLKPALPGIPGSEFCGVVEGCGPGVQDPRLAPGTRVAGGAFGGVWAERLCVPAGSVQPLGEGASAAEAAGLAGPYGTAHYALVGRAGLLAGETVFVLGAAGAVGLAAVQVAKALGARVIAGANGERKGQAACAEGADAAVDLSQPGWRDRLKALAPGGTVDVVLDPLGGDYTEPAFRSLGWGGRHLMVGFAGGGIPALRGNLALLKGASLVGVDARQFREREPEAAAANLAAVCKLHARGAIRPRVHAVYPFERWREALAEVEDRRTIGRVVLRWT
jgi:NADPH2:quinone reductase